MRALARDPSRIRELDGVEVVRGDLRDPDSLARAVEGCGVVFHVAADYRLWARDPEEMFRSNVEGTRNLLNAARKARASNGWSTPARWVASVFRRTGSGMRKRRSAVDEMTGPYKRSKFEAERVALESGDRRGHRKSYGAGRRSRFQADADRQDSGGFRARRDAGVCGYGTECCGCRATWRRDIYWRSSGGKAGERYILGSENLTLEQIFGKLAGIAGKPAPKMRVPYVVAFAVGAASTAWAGITGKEPLAPLDGVRMAKKKMWVSHDKAARELGYRPGSAEIALERAVEWFR